MPLDPQITCGCGRTMAPDIMRGKGVFRCGCGARVRVTVPDGKRCAGYRDGQRCRSAPIAGLPVDLCADHARELRQRWKLDFATQQRRADEERFGLERMVRHDAYHSTPRDPLGFKRPNPDAHPPIVYYLRFGDRIKIGTTTDLRMRLGSVPHDDVPATEPGDEALERRRHHQFQRLRITGEWFHAADALLTHIEQVKQAG